MPTIQLYKSGTKVVEHIAAEGAIDALDKVPRQTLNPCSYTLRDQGIYPRSSAEGAIEALGEGAEPDPRPLS